MRYPKLSLLGLLAMLPLAAHAQLQPPTEPLDFGIMATLMPDGSPSPFVFHIAKHPEGLLVFVTGTPEGRGPYMDITYHFQTNGVPGKRQTIRAVITSGSSCMFLLRDVKLKEIDSLETDVIILSYYSKTSGSFPPPKTDILNKPQPKNIPAQSIQPDKKPN